MAALLWRRMARRLRQKMLESIVDGGVIWGTRIA